MSPPSRGFRVRASFERTVIEWASFEMRVLNLMSEPTKFCSGARATS